MHSSQPPPTSRPDSADLAASARAPPPAPPRLPDRAATSLPIPSWISPSVSHRRAPLLPAHAEPRLLLLSIDPFRVLAVIASLRRIDPKVLAQATRKLFQGEPMKRRKGIWIDINNYEESERGIVVASKGSTITGAASSRSTATSGRCRRPPLASDGYESLVRRADSIMKSLSWSKAAPVTETAIRAPVGDNAVTSKALRWLLKQKRGLRRAGTGGRPDPYVYMALLVPPIHEQGAEGAASDQRAHGWRKWQRRASGDCQ
ncbi:hypothetical protein VPH35_100299 [Triticum aestivum]|uniref:uncharacterized protein n=1 Tax=Triticum aestivum TaxID=4565 RepID=UPI000843C874|nr:uncharacterized protein LOC123123118 [Triticum aestivum]XP_044399500.1 uncharacterized protein LOC123123118 [Triticum aestivum]XP_044399501.1 uncharacterized protein LOC123123118 [Triticum aestivum]